VRNVGARDASVAAAVPGGYAGGVRNIVVGSARILTETTAAAAAAAAGARANRACARVVAGGAATLGEEEVIEITAHVIQRRARAPESKGRVPDPPAISTALWRVQLMPPAGAQRRRCVFRFRVLALAAITVWAATGAGHHRAGLTPFPARIAGNEPPGRRRAEQRRLLRVNSSGRQRASVGNGPRSARVHTAPRTAEPRRRKRRCCGQGDANIFEKKKAENRKNVGKMSAEFM
jgi:hypothetical protein